MAGIKLRHLALIVLGLLLPTAVLAVGEIEGRWAVDTGAIIEFTGQRYRVLQPDGTVVEEGDYLIEEELLYTSSDNGEENLFAYTRSGDSLLLDTIDGQRITLRASTAAPTPNEPAPAGEEASAATPGTDASQGADNPLVPGGGATGSTAEAEPMSDGTPLAETWIGRLRGMRLTQMDSYSSGSAGGYWSKKTIDLCSDGRFFYSSASSVSVYGDTGGMGSSGGTDEQAGTWSIFTEGGAAGLMLKVAEDKGQVLRLDYNEGTFLNGVRTYVTPENASCS